MHTSVCLQINMFICTVRSVRWLALATDDRHPAAQGILRIGLSNLLSRSTICCNTTSKAARNSAIANLYLHDDDLDLFASHCLLPITSHLLLTCRFMTMPLKIALQILLILLSFCHQLCLGQTTTATAGATTYTNPVLKTVGADPYVLIQRWIRQC
jgi:hypothetical protein